jgi:benzodiazapine receptor
MSTPPLTTINYLNLGGYVLNVFVTFFSGPIFGIPGPGSLSDEFQVIITPAGFIFAIWGVIFTAQLIFTIVQMLPQYRSSEVVVQGVKYLYFYTCIAQSLWVFAFGLEYFFLSTIIMACILVPLYYIVLNQTKINVSAGEYWLFKFPFEIHCGWIFAAFVLNVNVTFIAWGAGAQLQFWLALFSLAFLIFIAIYALFNLPDDGSRPIYTIPSVLTWATFGIAIELINPSPSIESTFSNAVIKTFQILAGCLSASLLVGTVTLVIYKARNDNAGGATPVNEATPLVA